MNTYIPSRHSFVHTPGRASGYTGSAVSLAYGSRQFPLMPRPPKTGPGATGTATGSSTAAVWQQPTGKSGQ